MEVAWWLDHRSVDTILVALTDGDLAWDEGTDDFRWDETTPLPSVLKRRFRAEIVEKLGPVADELQCVKYLQHCETIADRPSWADRQRELMAATGNAVDVVRRLCAESRISPVAAPAI